MLKQLLLYQNHETILTRFSVTSKLDPLYSKATYNNQSVSYSTMALEISLTSAIFHTSKQFMKHPLKYFLLMAPAVCK
jgi:hypothetical protein